MKKKSLTKAIALLTASIFSLTYFFLIPLARIQYSQAQDGGVLPPKPAQPKTVSRIHIPTMANSTVMKTSEGEQALLIQDHLTSTRVIEMGGQGKNQEYYPYGTTRGEPNAVTDKQFTSHRSIADTGVYHAGARFYNPQLGVFVSADKVQGPNRYMYAMSNPALHTDPSGKIVPIIIAAIIIGGAAFGAGFGTGYEKASQEAEYGSVQDPTKVVMSGVGGAAVGAGAGYMGAVAVPAAIGAVSAGAAASGTLGFVGGAQIGVGACLGNPSCVDAVETGAQMVTGADLPTGFSAVPDIPTRGLRGTIDYYGDRLLHNSKVGTQLGKLIPRRVPQAHIGSPDDIVTVWKGLRRGQAGYDITPSISKQSWLWGHQGDTAALIDDRMAQAMGRGMTREQAIESYAWDQAIFPGDANPGTSWTTDITVARRYGQDGGVAQMQVPRSRLVSIPALANSRGQWPTSQCAIECEMYHYGIVRQGDYSMFEAGRSK